MTENQKWQEGLSRSLCATLADWRFEDLPAPVVDAVKLFVLDTLGVIGAATAAPGIPELNRRLGEWERGGRCTSLTGGWQGSPPAAAMANGAAGHALDYDDQHDPARVHAYCVVLPAALAAAEERGGVSGREFIAAVATGVELFSRLGLACYNSLGKGWHPTTAFGTLAGAVAAGRVLDLDGERLLHALGLAVHQMSGSRQVMPDGALAKRLGPGFAARSGVTSAFLAADGLTGLTRGLEGEAGMFNLHERGEVDPDRLTGGLGTDWEVLNISMKPYPCCRCNHTTIQLALELRETGVGPDDLEDAEVRMGAVNQNVVGYRYEPTGSPSPVVHAQFSAAYAFARALKDGRVGLYAYLPSILAEPDVVALAQKVRVLDDPEVDRAELAPARVAARLADGRVIEIRRTEVKGSPAEPMSDDEALKKFRDCMVFGLDADDAEIERLAETALSLEVEPDASVLIARFPSPTQARKAS